MEKDELEKNSAKTHTPFYRNPWFFLMLGVVVMIIPCIINCAYMSGLKLTEPNIAFTASDLLGFYGSFLAFVGTVALGALALRQNMVFKGENDIAQKKLAEINERLLNLDELREKRKLFELHFSFMEEAGNIYNPIFVLGDLKENRNSLDVYCAIKACRSTCLSIRRRLMFLDKANADNEFFNYALGKIDDISKIAMYAKEDADVMKKMTSKLFKFMRENSEEFNTKSLSYIVEMHSLIFMEDTADDNT